MYLIFSPLLNVLYFIRIAGFSIIEIVLGIYLFFGIGLLFLKKGARIRVGRLSGVFGLFLFFLVIGLVVGQGDLKSYMEVILKMGLGWLSYLLLLNLGNPFTAGNNLQKSTILGLFIVVGLVLVENVAGVGVNYSKYSYQVGFFADEGSLSRFGIVGIIFSIPFLLNKGVGRRLALFVFCCSILFLFIAISRNAILAALVAMLFLFSRGSNLVRLGLVGAVALLILGLDALGLTAGFKNKVTREVTFLQDNNSVNRRTLGSGRVARWEDAIKEFSEGELINKFFGFGHGIGPHGQVFDLLMRGGISCVVLGYLLYFRAFFVIRRTRKDSSAVYMKTLALWLAILVLSFGATPFYNYYLNVILFASIGIMERRYLLSRMSVRQRHYSKPVSATA